MFTTEGGIMKVLFCTDGSNISYNAMINFSKWFKNYSVDIISVADWTCLSDTMLGEGTNVMAYCTNNANAIINNARQFLEEHNIIVNRTMTNCGAVTDSILEAINKDRYDYIILGSNGKKGLQKWLGSVSQDISELSQNSVFISKNSNFNNKVVFAIDDSLLNSGHIERTLDNIDLKGKEINLITVYETPEYMFLEGTIDSNWINDIDKKQRNEAQKLLLRFEEIFNGFNLEISSKDILSGYPSKEIIEYCKKHDTDLIICGMRKRKLLSRIFSNSISKRILENTEADMLIMK